MAETVFFVTGQFSESLVQFRHEENGVIAKSGCATRGFEQDTRSKIRNDGEGAALLCNSKDADKARGPHVTFLPPHFSEQFLNFVRVFCAAACIARGKNARSATQGGNDEAGVVGKNEIIREPAVVQRLPGGVLREGRRGLIKRGKGSETRKERQLDLAGGRARGSQSLKFGELSGVRRREEELNGSGH